MGDEDASEDLVDLSIQWQREEEEQERIREAWKDMDPVEKWWAVYEHQLTVREEEFDADVKYMENKDVNEDTKVETAKERGKRVWDNLRDKMGPGAPTETGARGKIEMLSAENEKLMMTFLNVMDMEEWGKTHGKGLRPIYDMKDYEMIEKRDRAENDHYLGQRLLSFWEVTERERPDWWEREYYRHFGVPPYEDDESDSEFDDSYSESDLEAAFGYSDGYPGGLGLRWVEVGIGMGLGLREGD